MEEAGYLTKYASKVIVIHRRDKLRASKIVQKRAFDNEKIEFLWDSVVESINGDDQRVTDLSVKNVKTGETSKLEAGAVFIYIGFHPNNQMLPPEVKTDAEGYIETDTHMQTSVPGIFAVGDCRVQLVRQVTNAVGDGTVAAVAAEKYIEELEDKAAQRA